MSFSKHLKMIFEWKNVQFIARSSFVSQLYFSISGDEFKLLSPNSPRAYTKPVQTELFSDIDIIVKFIIYSVYKIFI